MNGYDIFKAMNGTDEEYIEASESFRRVRRRPAKAVKIAIGAAAAAAVMTTVSVGAYHHAVYRLDDNEVLSRLGGEGAKEWLESNGLTEVQDIENEHFGITMSAFMSDGNYCQAFFCVEALDEAAKDQLSVWYGIPMEVFYADTGEYAYGVSMWTDTDLTIDFDKYTDDYTYTVARFPIMDIGRPLELRAMPDYLHLAEVGDLSEGLSFTIDPTPNVETKTLANESGDELLLSPLGITWRVRKGEAYPSVADDLEWGLIKSDGSYEMPDMVRCYEINTFAEYGYEGEFPVSLSLYYHGLIDISDVDGVKINDDIYMDVNK